MAGKKGSTSTTKAGTWDPNSEKQWHTDKAAGGAAWAMKFIELARRKPTEYALQGWIDDAKLLFEGDRFQLEAFYGALQFACLGRLPKEPDGNPILTDSFDDSLCRAQEFAAFLEGYSERIDGGGLLDGEVAGQTMAIALLNDALLKLNRQRDHAGTPEVQEVHHG